MSPLDRYLIPDENSEIAPARSAPPASKLLLGHRKTRSAGGAAWRCDLDLSRHRAARHRRRDLRSGIDGEAGGPDSAEGDLGRSVVLRRAPLGWGKPRP